MHKRNSEPDASHAGTTRGRSRREPELDGLRAVAALMVAFLHCLFAVGMPSELRESLVTGPAGALTNGKSAVILFFVLSGSVLVGSFVRDVSPRGAAAFLARRAFRIYPAYLGALAAAWLATFLYAWIEPGAGVGSSVRETMAVRPGPAVLATAALVPGTAGGLLPPGWTLPIELVLSLALPLLSIAAVRTRGLLLVPVLGAAAWFAGSNAGYAFPFVLGMIARLSGAEHAQLRRLDSTAVVLLLAALTAFFVPPFWLRRVSPVLGLAAASFGALALVELARRVEPVRRVLSAPLLVRMGEMSYGFYLLHYMVVCFVASAVLGNEPATTAATAVLRWLLLVALVVPLSFLLAAASWRWIEAPAIAAGRRLGRRITGPSRDS